jgi:hypothetical protein
MGLEVRRVPVSEEYPGGWYAIHSTALGSHEFDPLTNPGDLMDVIGAMRERGCSLELELDETAAFARFVGDEDYWSNEGHVVSDWRGALARAVCRAALEAVKS